MSDSTASIYYDMKRRVIDALPATVVSAPVGELTRSDVEAAVRKIATSKSKGSRKHVRAATVNLVLRAFRRALSDAVDAGLSTSNPAKLVRTLPDLPTQINSAPAS